MKDTDRDRIRAALDGAEKAAAGLPAGLRRALVLRSLAALRDGIARPPLDTAELLAAVLAATLPTLVEATEGTIAEGLLEALGDVQNALLASFMQRRLAAARPARDADELTRITEGAPTVICVPRPTFTHEGAPAEPITLPEDDLVTGGDDGVATRDLVKPLEPPPAPDAPRPDVPDPPDRPRPDWRPEEGPCPDPPLIRLDPERRAVSVSDLAKRVVEEALEAIAALARDRNEGPFALRAEAEARILALSDAVLATRGDPLRAVRAHRARNADVPDGHDTWAAAFTLARFEGADALAAVRAGLEALPPDAEPHVACAAEALAIVPHPDAPVLLQDLIEADHPIARAVGVDLAGRCAALSSDVLRAHVLDPSPAVTLAALRACMRLSADEGAPLRPLIEHWILFPDRRIAFASSLCLIGWGHAAPYEDLVAGGRLAGILGPLALEILVLLGDARDKDLFAKIARRAPLTREVLSAIGRFGHPEAWSILIHSLGDDDLVDDAARALETLFGPIVDPASARNIKAWKAALAAKKPDPEVRLRLGRPWSPCVVADELDTDVLSRGELEARLRELGARVRIDARADLWAWGGAARAGLTRTAAEARRVSALWPAVL
jgi:hypothetical protein